MATPTNNANKSSNEATAKRDTNNGRNEGNNVREGAPREEQNNEAEDEDQKAEREESERQEKALGYANNVSRRAREKNENTSIESDEDMGHAQWLIANGYAEMHSIQEGMDTYNYILLTQDGLRALSSYNEEKAS